MKNTFAEKYLMALFIFLWLAGATLLILNNYFNLTPPIKPPIFYFFIVIQIITCSIFVFYRLKKETYAKK